VAAVHNSDTRDVRPSVMKNESNRKDAKGAKKTVGNGYWISTLRIAVLSSDH